MLKKSILIYRKSNIFIIAQQFSTSSEKNNDENCKHIYLKTYLKSHQDVAFYLKNNILYNNDGIIAVNKPYGLKRYEETEEIRKKNISVTSPSMFCTNHLSLQKTLPYLAKELKVEKLVVAKSPERYCSGVCVLTTGVDLKDKIVKKFADDKQPHYNFAAICVGIPSIEEYKCKLGLTFKKSSVQSESKKAYFIEDWSKRSCRLGLVKQVKIHHNTVSCNEDRTASLVQLLISRVGNHCVRVYLASRTLSPLLGDNIYGSLVQTVAGIPVLVNMWNPIASQQQKLSKSLREKLQLGSLKNSIVPAHLHLSQIKLPRLNKGKKDVIITAHPVDHFTWTCNALGLDITTFNYNIFKDTDNYDVMAGQEHMNSRLRRQL